MNTTDDNNNYITCMQGFINEKVIIYACRYIYTGVVNDVDDQTVVLTDASIIYDTGAHDKDKKSWDTVEPTWSSIWYIQLSSIESFGRAPF